MKRLGMFGGLVLVLAGGWMILGVWAFSSMVIGPDLAGADRDAELSRYWWSEMPTIGAGAAMVGVGFWLGSRDPRPRAG